MATTSVCAAARSILVFFCRLLREVLATPQIDVHHLRDALMLDLRNPEVQNLLLLLVGREIADFLKSKRTPASPNPTGKVGGLRPHLFPRVFQLHC